MKAIENKQFLCPKNMCGKCLSQYKGPPSIPKYFIFFNLALLYGQLGASSFVIASTSQSLLATMPVKSSQFSSVTMNGLQSSVMHSDHVKSVMSSLTGQFTAFTVTSVDSSVSSPNKQTMVKPSKQDISTTKPKLTKAIQTSSTIVKMTSPDILSSKTVTTPIKSRLSSHILFSASPVPETPSFNNSSILEVLPTLTGSLNYWQSFTASILNTTSNMMLSPSISVTSLGTSLSSFIPTLIPSVNTNSSHVIQYPTSSVKFNQTTSTTVSSNLSSLNVTLNGSISTMNSTSAPTVVVTSASYSAFLSVSVTSQSAPSMLYPTSTYSSVDVSSTRAVKSSCSNGNCFTLQPSATITQIRSRTVSRTVISSSLTKFQSQNTSTFSPSSDSVVSTTMHYKPKNGTIVTQDKEKSHTSLIIGLAVGLSVVLIVVIVVIVCYRRRRSSYQYNVFYDEQNIVMHPFDYSK